MPDLEPIQALIAAGRKDEASRQLARVLSADASDIQAWLLMAQAIDDPARKADCYRQALKLDPVNPEALGFLKGAAPAGSAPTPPPPPPSPSPLPPPPAAAPTQGTSAGRVSEPLAGQAPPREERAVGDYLTAGTEARALGRESVPAYLREIQAVPLEPIPPEPSRGSLFDAIDRDQPAAPATPPPIAPGAYREEPPPPPPPPWYRKGPARIILTLVILAAFGAAIFGGAKFMAASIPPTATLQPTLTVEILPSRTPQDTWTPLPTFTPRPTLTPIPNLGSLRVAILQIYEISLWRAGASSPVTGGANLPILISPRGDLVIFTRVGDLWSVAVENKKETQLMTVDDINALQPVDGSGPRVPLQLGWLPSSDALLFTTAFNPVDGGSRPADDLNRYNLVEERVDRLLDDGQGGEFYPSPDGKSIALSRPGSISVVDSDGENLREIFAFDPIITPDASPYYPKLTWTADSTTVLLILPPQDAANGTAASTAIWRLPVSEGEPQKHTEVNTNGGPLVISPDQTRILYQLNIQAETGAGELHSALMDGSGDTILQNGSPSRLVGWALDSRTYTFRAEADDAILVGTIGDSGSVPLANSPLLYDPTFQPEWVNSNQYLLQAADGIHLGYINSNTELIAKGSPGTIFYDFTLRR